MFSCEFCEISKTTFFIEHLQATTFGYLTKIFPERRLKHWITNLIKNKDLVIQKADKILLFLAEVTIFQN